MAACGLASNGVGVLLPLASLLEVERSQWQKDPDTINPRTRAAGLMPALFPPRPQKIPSPKTFAGIFPQIRR